MTTPDEHLLLAPRSGDRICGRCFNLTDGYGICFACSRLEPWLDYMAPISYSVSGGHLHRALWGYKHLPQDLARWYQLELAMLVAHYLSRHERCAAEAIGRDRFDLVVTVPSSDRTRDETHPLRRIIDRMLPTTRARHERVLRRTAQAAEARVFSREKYRAERQLTGETVLLLDDTWTTGANAQSSAAALKQAGSGRVAAVVIGRHLNRGWLAQSDRLAHLSQDFTWSRCPACPTLNRSAHAA